MNTGLLHTHYLVVILFFLIYVIKTILLLSDKTDLLAAFTKKTKVAEMIISALFLITGVYLTTQLPFGGEYDYLFFIKIAMVFASIPVAIIGFKKQNKILAALSLLLITGAFGLAEVYHKRKGIAKESSKNAVAATTDGKTLYEMNCKLCHGSDGKLGASGSKDLSMTEFDNEGIKKIILRGKGLMPASAVNEEQATAIAEYVSEHLKGQ
ncbi:MAG: c-type cytochrome [Bacteroidetes bacterium]|nr:c-type cytochrome [Bacteroidota bacterium]